MASRMDRYSSDKIINGGRSNKNKSLYEQIKEMDTYSNIEGVATIEKTNEIDISKVKEFINNRENYKKQKQLNSIMNVKEEKEEIKNEILDEEERDYNLNELLLKVKENNDISNKYRSLNDEQYEELKKLNKKKSKKFDIEKEEEELKALINTITTTKALKNLDNPDDVGLLDDLKANTMVGSADSIKKIIEEEKTNELEDYNTEKIEMDKSFYTSSFGFTAKDFDDLKDMNQKIKKGNKSIITLLMILILIILAVAIYIIFKSI